MNQIQITTPLSCLCVEGPDAKKFLQGQLTCNMDEIVESEFRLGAHCNPQGRIISFFRIVLLDDAYHLVMPDDLVDVAMAALKKYAVFFKTTLRVTTTDNLDIKNFSPLHDIQAGIPRIYAETSGKFLPHEVNLQCIHAVSFNKGCYTGQEIVARMHYRGQLKKHMYRAKGDNTWLAEITSQKTSLRGADLFCEGHAAGHVVDAYPIEEGVELLFIANKSDVDTKSFYLNTNTNPLHLLSLPYPIE